MNDIEMIRLCAEAMGFEYIAVTGTDVYAGDDPRKIDLVYNPLHDDAQAMALVKKLALHPVPDWDEGHAWTVFGGGQNAMSDDLNRAIVECVAKMQQAKAGKAISL